MTGSRREMNESSSRGAEDLRSCVEKMYFNLHGWMLAYLFLESTLGFFAALHVLMPFPGSDCNQTLSIVHIALLFMCLLILLAYVLSVSNCGPRCSSVVRPLAADATGRRFDFPRRQARSEINFAGLRVRRGWLVGAELSSSPTIWVHFFLDWVRVRTDNLGSYSYSSRAFGFKLCLANIMCVHCAIAHHVIHPFGVGKSVPAESRG